MPVSNHNGGLLASIFLHFGEKLASVILHYGEFLASVCSHFWYLSKMGTI